MKKLSFNVELPKKIGGRKLTSAMELELSELKRLIENLEKSMTQKRMSRIAWLNLVVSDMDGESYSVRAWVGKKKDSWS